MALISCVMPTYGRRGFLPHAIHYFLRQDYPDKDPACATFNISVRRSADGSMAVSRVPIPQMPDELKQVIEENK